LDSFNSSNVKSPTRKSADNPNNSQHALALIQIKDVQPAILNTPIANKSNILAKEHTLQIEITNTSPVSDPIPSSDESFDKENNENYKKKTLDKNNNSHLIIQSSKYSLARNKLNKIIETDQQLTPIVNIHKASNRKIITATEIEDDIDLDELDDKKLQLIKIQTRLSSTAYESPNATTNNKTRSSVRKSAKKIIEEEDDEINDLSENDEIVASSAGDVLTNTKQPKSIIISEEETINKSKAIFKNKSVNRTKNNDILPEAIDFAPSNLSRKRDKSTNKTPPAKEATNKKKLVKQNKVVDDEELEEEEEIPQQQQPKENANDTNKSKQIDKHSEDFEDKNLSRKQQTKSKTIQDDDEDTEDGQQNYQGVNNKNLTEKTNLKSGKMEKKTNNEKKISREIEKENVEVDLSEESEHEENLQAHYEYSIAVDNIQEKQQIDDFPFEFKNEPSSVERDQEDDDDDENEKKIPTPSTNKNLPKHTSSKIIIVKQSDANNKSKQKNKIIQEDESTEKPEKVMPPPPVPTETSHVSAESTTKRRSTRLESAKSTNNGRLPSSAITEINVNLMPPNKSQRNLTRQFSNLNNNNNIEEIASTTQEIQDEQELMQSQNNKFIRKSMTKTINSTTGSNQTVNSSTASSIFKSKQVLLSAQLPTAPLFNSTITTLNNKNTNKKNTQESQEEQENDKKKKSSKDASSRNKKKQTDESERSEDEADQEIQKSPSPVKQKRHAFKDIDGNKQKSKEELENEKKKKSSKAASSRNKKKQIDESERSEDEDDQEIQKSPSPVKQKRHAFKDIDGNKQKSQETSPASVPTMKKKKNTNRPRLVEREEPVIEPLSQETNEEEQIGLRRSKRAKIDKNSKAIYHYSPITDFSGNTIYIQKVIGTTGKNDEWTKYISHFNEQMKTNEKKRKHNALLKEHGYENEIRKDNKKKRIANRNKLNEDDSNDNINDNNHQEYYNNNENNINENLTRKEIILNTQDNPNISQTLLLESDMSNINTSQESVLIQDPGVSILDNSKVATEHLYCYQKMNERKNYEECKTGVSIAASSNNSGVLRLDPSYSTKTNSHAMRVVYFVQSGECLVSINNIISKHSVGDVIKVPANISYKLKNIAKNKNDKLYLYFQFLDQS
jgi:mannose-6-phosphate isomerase-like protein (cupin superfamily)